MRVFKAISTFILSIFLLCSCEINISYPPSAVIDYMISYDVTTSPLQESSNTRINDTDTSKEAEDTSISPTQDTLPKECDTSQDETDVDLTDNPATINEPFSETESEIVNDEAIKIHFPITLAELTSPISNNQTATLSIVGMPNTEYSIEVFYSTVKSTANGLENKISDDLGVVSWNWKIGSRVKSGNYKITITGGGSILETEIRID